MLGMAWAAVLWPPRAACREIADAVPKNSDALTGSMLRFRSMTPERWRRVEELYHAALTTAVGDRAAFLARQCTGDDALRREVESLLAQDGSAEGFFERPLAAPTVGPSVMTGRRLGVFEVQAQIGAGGMGEVYRATDTG